MSMNTEMKLKAENLHHMDSARAPKEWEQIPEIKNAKPGAPHNDESLVSLQRLDGTNICIWMTKGTHLWQSHGAFFHVTLEEGDEHED